VLRRVKAVTSVLVILFLIASMSAGCARRASEALQRELADCEAEAQAAEAKAAEAEARIETLQVEIDEHENRIEELEAELEALKGGD
jgi:peptidoglycan hydrolase CwlO-like protein